jgi:iron-sulfur cluster assembly accessory protein
MRLRLPGRSINFGTMRCRAEFAATPGWSCQTMAETIDRDVTITGRGLARVAEILKGEPPGAMLRVSVSGGGCSGFQYVFGIETARTDDDILIGDGAVVVDPVSVDFLKGSEIDFVTDLMGQAFRVRNPNATASCGCGTSFSI